MRITDQWLYTYSNFVISVRLLINRRLSITAAAILCWGFALQGEPLYRLSLHYTAAWGGLHSPITYSSMGRVAWLSLFILHHGESQLALHAQSCLEEPLTWLSLYTSQPGKSCVALPVQQGILGTAAQPGAEAVMQGTTTAQPLNSATNTIPLKSTVLQLRFSCLSYDTHMIIMCTAPPTTSALSCPKLINSPSTCCTGLCLPSSSQPQCS